MSKTLDMTKGPLLKQIILYSLPIMATGILQLLFNAADLMVVGKFSTSLSVGAVGATSQITALIVNLFLGISTGCSVTVAHAIGAKDDDRVKKTVHTAIPVALIGGIVLTVIGIAFSRLFLIWMGTPEGILDLSTTYMQIYFAGMTATLVYNFGASILRASGDTKRPLWYLMLSGALNVVLNVIFVVCFHMDVAGVALATTLTQILSAVLVVLALMKREDSCRFMLSEMKIDQKSLEYILRIGVPAGLQNSLFSIANVLIQSSVNSFDSEAVVSGCAAGHNLGLFVYAAQSALIQTTTNFVGQNYGAKNYKRIDKTVLYCGIVSFAIGAIFGPLVHYFAPELLKLYVNTGTDSPEMIEQVIKYGVIRLGWLCRFYCICGLADVMTGVLNGLGKSNVAMIISVFGACIYRIVWVYTAFAYDHTLDTLFMTYPISWAAIFIASLIAFFIIRKKIYKKRAL